MIKWIKTVKKIFSTPGSERSLVHIEDDGFMSDNIAVNIEDIIKEEDHEEIGKLHVLSLTEFHQALGKTWDAREEKIFLLTEGVLRDRVGAGNRWEHQSKEIYIMLFPTLSEIEADARAFDIAEELGRKIIGERFDGTRRPLVRVAGVDPKEALAKDGHLDIEKLEQAGRAGEAAGDANSLKPQHKKQEQLDDQKKPKTNESDDGVTSPETDWKKNHHDQHDPNLNWQKQAHNQGEHATNWKEEHHRKGLPNDPNWRKMEKGADKKEDAGPQWVSMEKKESTPTDQSFFGVTFAPCWDRQNQQLRLYRALLEYSDTQGVLHVGRDAYRIYKSAEQRLKVDRWLLQQTTKSLSPMSSKNIVTPIFIPVHADSLRGPHLDSYLNDLNKFAPALRENYFILEILDDGSWSENERCESLQKLKACNVRLAFTLSLDKGVKLEKIDELDWIGIDLDALNENIPLTEEQIENMQIHAQQNHQMTYIFGLQSREQIKDMLALGADAIAGNALVRTTAKLRPPFDLPIDRLIN
jgi:EAL domain-containing protein (putative c-di-GMP-specific phosphodiesterase class I)